MKKIYQKIEKEKNFLDALSILKEKKMTTKLELSKILNLSIPTVTSIINELLRLNIMIESKKFKSSGGRKALYYEFNPNSVLSLGVIIKENLLIIALVDLIGNIIFKKDFLLNFKDNDILTEGIKNNIILFLADIDSLKENICGIGISVLSNQFIINKKELEKFLNIKIRIFDSVNSVFIGNLNNIKLLQKKIVLYLDVNEYIYFSIIHNESNSIKTINTNITNISHMELFPLGKPCDCGKTGCLKMYSSNTSIINNFNQQFCLNHKTLNDVFNNNLIYLEEGKSIIKDFSNNLAILISNLNVLFSFDKIIISGELFDYSLSAKNILIESILSKKINNLYIDDIKFSENIENTMLIGNGINFFNDFILSKLD